MTAILSFVAQTRRPGYVVYAVHMGRFVIGRCLVIGAIVLGVVRWGVGVTKSGLSMAYVR